MFIRERLRPYIKNLMQAAHDRGTPVMRTLFYEFPIDPACWEVEDEYMFGPDLLVAPVMEAGVRKRSVYLPAGSNWKNAWNEELFVGGETITVDAPLNEIPLFLRAGIDLPIITGE